MQTRGAVIAFLTFVVMLVWNVEAAEQTNQKVADAKPGDIRLFVSNGIHGPIEAVRADLAKALGRRSIVIEYGSSRGLQAIMEADQAFEVAIVTPEVINEVEAKGKVIKGSRVDIGRSPIGVLQRGGTKVDISTLEKLKTAILGAKFIRYPPTGAAKPMVDNAGAKLGIADALKDKTRPPIGRAEPAPALTGSEYELFFQLDSELLAPPAGQIYIGSVPRDLQIPAVMTAAVGAKGDARAAQALIDFLKGPAIEPALASSRMTR
jgi:molybdate transport system substrate-binding protein